MTLQHDQGCDLLIIHLILMSLPCITLSTVLYLGYNGSFGKAQMTMASTANSLEDNGYSAKRFPVRAGGSGQMALLLYYDFYTFGILYTLHSIVVFFLR